jgi:5-methylcytosine-specific restriction endonuclease McrA
MTVTAATNGQLRPAPLRQSGKPITNLQALLALYLLVDWCRHQEDGRRPPDFFKTWGVMTGIARENRGVTIRLARGPCVGCGEQPAEDSTGDHIVPVSSGGPYGATNYMPMCKRCNSRKGTKDLLHWWLAVEHRDVFELPYDVLTAYASLMYARVLSMRTEHRDVEPALGAAVAELLEQLSRQERRDLRDRVRAITGQLT